MHLQNGLVGNIIVERGDHIDGELLIPSVNVVIQLFGKGVVLPVFIADFAFLEGTVENQRFEFRQHVSAFHFRAFDLFFNVLFFISQILIDVAVSLDIGLLFQLRQGFVNVFFELGHVLIKAFQHKNAQVADSRLELFDVFD